MENIQYKLDQFEGPLDLLLTLIQKHKINIDDIPISLLCEQYMTYIQANLDMGLEVASEFLYMASELMLIKSRMLLPRNPETDEDPRDALRDTVLEYQRAKLAASELSDLFGQYGSTRLLIDAGKSGKMIGEALDMIGVDPKTLDALLITHEHSDHICGAGVLARKYKLPVYATEGTWAAMEDKLGNVPGELRRTFDTFSDFYVGDIGVVPFAVPHDAAEPVGYRLWGGNVSISTATDLGFFPRTIRDAIAGSSLVLLESNHDPDMLRMNDHYTMRLKQRILSNHGHLSNDACAEALLQLVDHGTQHVILGHLSGENNTPALARRVSEERMQREGVRLGVDLFLDVARRDQVGSVYTLEADV